MAVPKCAECEKYAYGYGRISYRICNLKVKLIAKAPKASPKWCPLRKDG